MFNLVEFFDQKNNSVSDRCSLKACMHFHQIIITDRIFDFATQRSSPESQWFGRYHYGNHYSKYRLSYCRRCPWPCFPLETCACRYRYVGIRNSCLALTQSHRSACVPLLLSAGYIRLVSCGANPWLFHTNRTLN